MRAASLLFTGLVLSSGGCVGASRSPESVRQEPPPAPPLPPARPEDERLPEFGEYVYVEELPEALTKVAPIYPDAARQARVEGTVVVQALVGTDGRVKEALVMQSIPMLDDAAVESVRQWVFKPAESRGRPVAVWIATPIRFSLH